MRTYKYKTLKGLIKRCDQMQICNLFTGTAYFNNKGLVKFVLSDVAKLEAAKLFANSLLSSPSAKKRLIYGLVNGLGDLSYFQCFYINLKDNGFYIDNSLSGEAYEHCKRMYLKSVTI